MNNFISLGIVCIVPCELKVEFLVLGPSKKCKDTQKYLLNIPFIQQFVNYSILQDCEIWIQFPALFKQ